MSVESRALGNEIVTDSIQEELALAKALSEKGEYQKGLETLQNLLSTTEFKDPLERLDVLILKTEMSWRSGKLDEGHDSVEEAETLLSSTIGVENEELQKRKGMLLSQAGVVYWYRGELDRAKEYHQESLEIREELGDRKGVATALNNLGLVYWSKGELDKATECYKKGLTINEELNDERGLSSVLNNLANISASMGELDVALEYHQQSLEIKERIATKQDIASSLTNIGVIFRLMGDLSQATEYYNKSLAIQSGLSIGPEFALALNNLGDIFHIKGELDIALEFYQRSLLIYEDMGAKEGIAMTLANIGECYRRKVDPEVAFEYYNRSLTISEDMGNSSLIAVVLDELVMLALDGKDPKLAKEYLAKLEQVSEESGSVVAKHRYQVSNALFLRRSGRTRERAKAEEILEKVVEEDIADHTVTVSAMIHLCDLLILELKATGDEEILNKIKDLTHRIASIANEQASHPLIVETYLLQSKLAMVDFDLQQAQQFMSEARKLADEKGLQRLSHILEHESKALQYQVKRWESILQKNPSRKDMVDLTNLNDLLEKMVQKTVETHSIESEDVKPKYRLIHQDLLKDTEKSEISKFRVGIAQIGLSDGGDILNELYEEKDEGLIGLREDAVELTRTKLREMVERAHSEGVNVLLFPEMTIDLSFERLSDDVAKLAKEFGIIIIPGSFHDKKTRRNVCRVFGPDGVLWEQEKHIPAIIHIEGKRFIEKIETAADSRNVIICNTEFGRIAIAICRDFLDMDLRVELKNSDPPVDLVINPAFTPVTVDFKAAHFDARRSIYAY